MNNYRIYVFLIIITLAMEVMLQAAEDQLSIVESKTESIIDQESNQKMISSGKLKVNPASGEKTKIGKWLTKLDSGALLTEENFNDAGLRDGPQVNYTANERIWTRGEFKDGKKSGIAKIYNPVSGALLQEMSFLNDELDGEVKTYSPEGTVLKIEVYKNGKKVAEK